MDKEIERKALPNKLLANGSNGKADEPESKGIEGTKLLGARLKGKVDNAAELGIEPDLATENKGKALSEVPERELKVPKLEGILPDARPEEEARGRPKDSGVANPLDWESKPDNSVGRPEETPGKELGKELRPGREDADHNGPQIGKVASESEVDNKEPIGCELDSTSGADSEVVKG